MDKLDLKVESCSPSSDEPNNFPRLPFIEDEIVVAWFASFASRDAFVAARSAAEVEQEPFETFILSPGERSRLRHQDQPEP